MGRTEDIWVSIDHLRPDGMGEREFRRTYSATKAAMEFLGYKMKTTVEEFDLTIVPTYEGYPKYMERKIIVIRDGIESKPTQIAGLISGYSSLKTDAEMKIVYKKASEKTKSMQPKGIATNNNKEKDAIDALNNLLQCETYFDVQHNAEARNSDVAYKLKNDTEFIGFQAKTSSVDTEGRLHFGTTAGDMVGYLKDGLCVYCIGLTNNRERISVVWIFHGDNAMTMLENFKDKCFTPMVTLKFKTSKQFTLAYNKQEYRYEIGTEFENHLSERQRLLEQMKEIVKNGTKRSLDFLNTDKSQIGSLTNQKEQDSYFRMRDVLKDVANIEKLIDDNYSVIDFRVNNARIQDKMTTSDQYSFRKTGRYPYNPDALDILQISFLDENIVYLFPMRSHDDDKIVPFLSIRQLMTQTPKCGKNWKENNKNYRYDMSKPEDVLKYVKACEAAHAIPPLTDRDFYKTLIESNADLFEKELEMKKTWKIGSKKKALTTP